MLTAMDKKTEKNIGKIYSPSGKFAERAKKSQTGDYYLYSASH